LVSKFFEIYSFQDVRVDHARWGESRRILTELADHLNDILILSGIKSLGVTQSVGRGGAARIPWIAFLDPRASDSPKSGYYCTLLFDPEIRKIYLTLMIGVTSASLDVPKGTTATQRVSQIAQTLAEKIDFKNLARYGIIPGPIPVESWDTILQRSYASGSSAYQEFDVSKPDFSIQLGDSLCALASEYGRIASEGFRIKSDEIFVQKLALVLEPARVPQVSGSNLSLVEFLTKKGYRYDTQAIENILLSLKVKRMLILTGNSGSGKTRLASLVAEYISMRTVIEQEAPLNVDVKVGRSSDSGGWTLNRDQVYLTLTRPLRE